MASDQGRGTTVTFGTSSFSIEWVSVTGPSYSRDAINTSHMGTTTAHTFTPADLYDAGELSLRGRHTGAQSPPITGAAETITIDWGGSGQTSVVTGFLTGYSPGAEAGESDSLMEVDVTLKLTGTVTF